jgi:methylthioribose-1-phosphate isomerase
VGEEELTSTIITACEEMLTKDVSDNIALGDNGAEYLLDILRKDSITVLTIW